MNIAQYKIVQVIDHHKTGDNARNIRILNKITLRQAAEIMGCSAMFLSDLEHGRRKWSIKWIDKFEKAIKAGIPLERKAR